MTGRNFGDAEKPLLVSVRSGARASMPGMMDTVLNLGLNDETVQAIAREAGDERFAYDSYRRFIQMYSDVVLGVDHGFFEEILEDKKADLGVEVDTALTAEDWKGSSPPTRPRSRKNSASLSRKTRANSSGAPSVLSFQAG